MNVRVTHGPLAGVVSAPASKSYAHRYLIAAAMADVPTELEGLTGCEDIDATVSCLRALGATFDDGVLSPGMPGHSALLSCGESGTTLRLLLPVVTALGVEGRFIGSGRLPRRPLGPLVDELVAHGVEFDKPFLPLTVSGRLRSGRYTLPGDISSQFVSGLLMAMPLLDSGSTVHLTTPLASAGYVSMTREVLDAFSISVMSRDDGFMVPGTQRYRSPGRVTVEGDWSAAAYLLLSGALGGDVSVRGLAMDSVQPDRHIVQLLRAFGAQVDTGEGRVRVRPGKLNGIEADLSQTPDLLPALAVLGAVAEGTTRLTGVARLRMKESDRLEGACATVRALGGRAETTRDALVVHGGTLRGGTVSGRGDHRIVMAAAAAASACTGDVLIEDAEAVSKSYPGYFEALRQLEGDTHVIHGR